MKNIITNALAFASMGLFQVLGMCIVALAFIAVGLLLLPMKIMSWIGDLTDLTGGTMWEGL